MNPINNEVLLANMKRCLIMMEHANRCAEREEKMGYWLRNWTEEINHWDNEFQKARNRYLSANSSTGSKE